MKNLLAIVIPFYKIDFFEKTLQSISAQNDKRFTLYIGNDNSPSDPIRLIESLLSGVNYKYIPYSENVGGSNLAKQWERVLENVDEEWFQVLGDDDYISENFVSEFYNHINRILDTGSQVIRYNYVKIDENDTITDRFFHEYETVHSADFMRKKMNWETGSSLSENIFRTDNYVKYGFEKFPLAWHSDDYALLRLSNFGYMYHINSACAYVRVSSKSISGSTTLDKEKTRASLLFIEKLLSDHKVINHKQWLQELKYHYLFLCRKNSTLPNSKLSNFLFESLDLRFLFTYIKSIFSIRFRRF